MALQQLPPPCSPAVGSRPRCNQGIIPDESKRELSKRTNPGGKFPKYIQERLCHTDTAFLIPFHNLAASTTKTPCLAATAMPHRHLTASRHRNASPPHRHTVGSRHGATVPPSQPRSGNCRLTAHRDATHGPPHCYPACSADSTLPTLPQCRVAPWCDRATNPTAPPSVILV